MKINTALIFREENKMREKLMRFTNQFSDVELEIKNASEYWAWQRRVREDAIQNDLERLKAQRLMSKQSLENAILAKNNLLLERKANATNIANENRNLCRASDEAESALLEEKQNAVNCSQELRVNPQIARNKVLLLRKMNANQINNESREFEYTALKKVNIKCRKNVFYPYKRFYFINSRFYFINSRILKFRNKYINLIRKYKIEIFEFRCSQFRLF